MPPGSTSDRQARPEGLLIIAIGFASGVGAILLFAWLAQGVLERQSLRLDQDVLVVLQARASPSLLRAALAISLLGGVVLWVLLAVALGSLAWKRHFNAAVSLLVAVVGAQLLNNVLK